jgi:hypothetical protein
MIASSLSSQVLGSGITPQLDAGIMREVEWQPETPATTPSVGLAALRQSTGGTQGRNCQIFHSTTLWNRYKNVIVRLPSSSWFSALASDFFVFALEMFHRLVRIASSYSHTDHWGGRKTLSHA